METNRLATLSRRLQRVLWLVGLLMVEAAMLPWLIGSDVPLLPRTLAVYAPARPFTASLRLAGAALELLPLAAALYALIALYKICSRYAAGTIFTAEMASLNRAFGRGLLLLGAANGLNITLITALLSFWDTGKISLQLGLSTADLYLLIVGAAVVMLGLVMEEAHRIYRDNLQIV